MKPLLPRAATLLVALVLGGCSSQVSQKVLEATTAPNEQQNRAFNVETMGTTIGGKYFPSDSHSPLGTLSIDAAHQKAYWNGEELILMDAESLAFNNATRYFFSKRMSAVICAGPLFYTNKNLGAVALMSRWQEIGIDVATKGRTSDSLSAELMQLHTVKNSVDLFANFKVIDGQFIALTSITHAGKLSMANGLTSLDREPALVTIVQESDASRFLCVKNSSRVLMIWANGGWYTFPIGDVSLGLSGVSEDLAKQYLLLREAANTNTVRDSPETPAEVKRRMHSF
jgi:hypothetical protein